MLRRYRRRLAPLPAKLDSSFSFDMIRKTHGLQMGRTTLFGQRKRRCPRVRRRPGKFTRSGRSGLHFRWFPASFVRRRSLRIRLVMTQHFGKVCGANAQTNRQRTTLGTCPSSGVSTTLFGSGFFMVVCALCRARLIRGVRRRNSAVPSAFCAVVKSRALVKERTVSHVRHIWRVVALWLP